MKDEVESIERARDGDKDAFEAIVDHYKNYVFAIVLRFIKDNSEAENVVQEVFLQVYLSLDKYEDDNFKAWISRVASNKSIDYIRAKKRHFKEEAIEHNEDIVDIKRNYEVKTPEEIFIKREREDRINKLCSSLPPIYKDTIFKFYMEGKSYEEIAKDEGVTEKTIASRLYRGRNMLKGKWRDGDEAL